MSDRVLVSISDGVADVRFNRADKRNALDQEQFSAIAEAGERLKSEPGVRVVVLSGDGASFCAGLDFSIFGQFADTSAGSGGPRIGTLTESGITHLAQQVCWVWQELPVPVIAAVHGHAIGGGAQIALGADIRISTPGAKWSIREVHWGLIPDMTGTFVLSQLVRPDVAKELTFTARMFDGAEAHALGVVTRLADDPYTAAHELAAEIAGRSPHAVRGVKALYNRVFTQQAAEQFAMERQVIGGLIGTPNQVEAITANLGNRPPVFTDPA
ncbi:MAG TPA: crotonase/enoyl-CoA hydratase family protein [Ilumatobacter sp.]|nr:crotonase/enoyl-CoA hydratase family protein [Ilumatobacter sp.]